MARPLAFLSSLLAFCPSVGLAAEAFGYTASDASDPSFLQTRVSTGADLMLFGATRVEILPGSWSFEPRAFEPPSLAPSSKRAFGFTAENVTSRFLRN